MASPSRRPKLASSPTSCPILPRLPFVGTAASSPPFDEKRASLRRARLRRGVARRTQNETRRARTLPRRPPGPSARGAHRLRRDRAGASAPLAPFPVVSRRRNHAPGNTGTRDGREKSSGPPSRPQRRRDQWHAARFPHRRQLRPTAALAEMLLQSHGGEIALLPALPPAWKQASVAGLRARGGFRCGVKWQGGALATAPVQAQLSGSCTVRARTAFPLGSDRSRMVGPEPVLIFFPRRPAKLTASLRFAEKRAALAPSHPGQTPRINSP